MHLILWFLMTWASPERATAAAASEVVVNGRPLLTLELGPRGLEVRVLDRGSVAAHHTDHRLFVFLTPDGRLYAVDVHPLPNGGLPRPFAALIADLGAAVGDLNWWTPLLGVMSEAQAAEANRGAPPDERLNAGDVVVARQDLEQKQLLTIVPRHEVESEIDCQRALDHH